MEIIEKRDDGIYARKTMKFQILGQFPRAGRRWQIGEKTARKLESKNRFIIDNGIVKKKYTTLRTRILLLLTRLIYLTVVGVAIVRIKS